ncbi:MAG: asparagine synthase-related protein, partial [Brevundimonas sp.]
SDWLVLGPHPSAAGEPLDARLHRLGWRRVDEAPAVWVSARHPLPARRLGAGLLLGRYVGAPPEPLADRPAEAWAAALMSAGWGLWVALLPSPTGVTAVRDPSGALDAFVWRRGSVWIAAGDACEGLDDLLPHDARIDLDRVALMLRHAATVSGAAAIVPIEAVPPGGGVALTPEGTVRRFQVWTPAAAAGRRADPASLSETVDTAVATVLKPHGRVLGEVSGGFDSAVVATSAAGQGLGDRVPTWLNFHAVEPEADERAWARAVADKAGLRLSEHPKTPKPLTRAALERLAQSLRPALQGLDVEYDAGVAERLAATGATGLLTGQGGDAVFFQFGTPAVVRDRVRRLGLRGLDPRYLHRIARWTRVPVWRLLEAAARDRLGRPQRRNPDADPSPPAEVHPWLEDLDAVPPARRGQIRQLVNAQVFHGDCLRRRAAELLHPLLTQPVMEAGLGIPADVLVEGGRDRDLARRRFADRLPEAVLSRRGKGELSTYYGQVVRLTLPLANDLLIDGALVSAGLVDPEALSADLDPAHLIADGAYNTVLIRLVLELWLRRWRARLAARGQPLFEPGQDAAV